jgi:hypothetical protein
MLGSELTPDQGSYANSDKGHSGNRMHPLDWHTLGKFLTNPHGWSIS